MKKIIALSLLLMFCSFNYGCNTIAGTTKGIVEDVKSVVPGL
jgi:predicted small secreted protein